MEVINALGRSKTAVARIYIKEGQGNITVNDKDYKTIFQLPYCNTRSPNRSK